MSFIVFFIGFYFKVYKGDSFYIGVVIYVVRMGFFFGGLFLRDGVILLYI